MTVSKSVVVIGGGPAGIGAAYALHQSKQQYCLIEKSKNIGGHSSSSMFCGEIFDEGPHISFTPFENLRNLFHSFADIKVRKDEASVLNYFHSNWITHPVMANLGQLDSNIANSILESFLTRNSDLVNAETYYDWLIATYGSRATEIFYVPYTLKYWRVHPREMSLDWVHGRFFSPKDEQVLEGMQVQNSKAHYVTTFYYPSSGGFNSFFKPNFLVDNIKTDCEVVYLNVKQKYLRLADSTEIQYEKLISTMPLPELINIIDEPKPAKVKTAADDLKCTSLILVNLYVNKYIGPRIHWFYIYNLDYFSTRVTIQTAISRGLDSLNDGVGIQVEVYCNDFSEVPTDISQIVVAELIEIGLFTIDALEDSEVKHIRYANVLFDHSRKGSLETISTYLRSHDIESVGRFGSWDYLWSDESFLEGVNSIDPSLGGFLRKGGENA
jgi:protoporphyrinogen oxidase